jgi:hypothetical protein
MALMNALSDQFKADLLKFMEAGLQGKSYDSYMSEDDKNTRLNDDETLVELLSFEDFTHSSGYCETCYYETTYCRLKAVTSEARVAQYIYTDDFTDLVRYLTSD